MSKLNLKIYELLYEIETGLRELIIERLSKQEGPKWYKSRLPKDILDKYSEAKNYEKDILWSQSIPHHPIYYIDFADLKKIIERRDNWDDVFQSIFSRKDILTSTLSELEPIRNKVAHNRKVSDKDHEIVKAAHMKISEIIGRDYFAVLVNKLTYALDISDQLNKLRGEAKQLLKQCLKCDPIYDIASYSKICDSWWFDESYLGQRINHIQDYFLTIKGYMALPRSRGAGHKIELWIKRTEINKIYDLAESEFSILLDNWRQ